MANGDATPSGVGGGGGGSCDGGGHVGKVLRVLSSSRMGFRVRECVR